MTASRPTLLPRLTGLAAAALYLPGLAQKVVGDPNSVWLFERVGLGDAGRWGTALAEAIVVVSLVNPGFRLWGALGSMGVISGALLTHLTTDLGIAVQWPGESEADPTLFVMAVAIFLLSALTAGIEWRARSTAPEPPAED